MTNPSFPEAKARKQIDRMLADAGWVVQDRADFNPAAATGIAVREFPLKTGFADYLLLVDRMAVGAVEAKKMGTPLSGVESQSAKYSDGLPDIPPAWRKPLPFLYESTGVETFFTNGLDPDPRSRQLFAFHRAETLRVWVHEAGTLRTRVLTMPDLDNRALWPVQTEAIENLERSLRDNRPRALIQMATGTGKTFTAVNFVYRLIKHAGARRVLFLVDRSNLGRQAYKEFQQFVTPDDGRKFTELYNVQHLQANVLDDVSRVCITTVQRLYSILSGEPDYDAGNEEASLFDGDLPADLPPKQVIYNRAIPIEYFDVIVIDECHRSIYNVWRQVLEYFDAFLIGLTATPSKQTFGFFHRNLVMEYSRTRAVADGINVDGEVYRIRTQITEAGSTVEAGYSVGQRDALTRALRWERLDEDFSYAGSELDRSVVAEDQIRTVIRTFRDRLFTEIFPGRKETPKTLIFAKDDSHAEDIVRIVREEFGRGNDFCKKITYKVSGVKPEDLIQDFRISYHPRIAVTVDMIATGTDIKPLEIVFFMRLVKSRVLFEQMRGRGGRVVTPTELQQATPDADSKDHFVIVDAVGVVDSPKVDSQSLERKRSVPFDKLLEQVAWGAHDADTVSSLAARLARLERRLRPEQRQAIAGQGSGHSLKTLANRLLDAIDPDHLLAVAQQEQPGLDENAEEYAQVIEAVGDRLRKAAVEPLVTNPALRALLIAEQQATEQTIDTVSLDVVREAGFSPAATASARETVESFQQFIEAHIDEITALQIIYSQPYSQRRVTDEQVAELAERLRQPPHNWSTESLWRAYAQLEKDKVRDAGGRRVLSDLVSLVRHAIQLDDELAPYPELVQRRYKEWLAVQEAHGRRFSAEQRWWLDTIAAHIGVNLDIRPNDLSEGEFYRRGGLISARHVFGGEVNSILMELNNALVVV
ncbi:MAG TPA: type I restriction-modification enzyme R subunit C-terminal domain-containing protein [Caldilinea sp.]|nr:type I restriction-modification enzyme R subunit C-terminal domain-containing protein [Caldilinea sp.]